MQVILYTTHCPRCEVLAKKLAQSNINYTENTDVEEMLKMGMASAPALKVDENLMNFHEAVQWINQQRG